MKCNILAIAVSAALLASSCHRERSIVVLFDNDVHCSIDGYARLAGLRDAVADTAWTAVVSCGDYLQGGTVGAISKGQYIVDVMRQVGYTAVTLGNHEFDYKMPRMFELLSQLGVPVVCTNLCDISTARPVFTPYVVKSYGRRKVAFVGVVTPSTLDSEGYAFFDGEGCQRYDLMPFDVYDLVQQAADDARRQGADYVIVLSHLGEMPSPTGVDSRGLIAATSGIDAVLDGHTHSVIPPAYYPNREGKPVLTTQTGTQMANIGKLVIAPDGSLTCQLLPLDSVCQTSKSVQHTTDSVKTLHRKLVGRRICASSVDLQILDSDGSLLVRRAETNAGDIVADALRFATGADIAVINGGAIRSEAKRGELTYGDLLSMLPYDNRVCVAEVNGETLMEMLTANTAMLPTPDGQFPQVSGMTYTATVAPHGVRDVMVLDSSTGSYRPLVPKRTYTVATIDYCLSGGGLRGTLSQAPIVSDAIAPYCDVLVEYIQHHLGGNIGEEYAVPQGRITVTGMP